MKSDLVFWPGVLILAVGLASLPFTCYTLYCWQSFEAGQLSFWQVLANGAPALIPFGVAAIYIGCYLGMREVNERFERLTGGPFFEPIWKRHARQLGQALRGDDDA